MFNTEVSSFGTLCGNSTLCFCASYEVQEESYLDLSSSLSVYEGKLERSTVLKALCAGFKETADPPICMSGGKSSSSLHILLIVAIRQTYDSIFHE